uniref:SURP motif domain-containing protein n=1 Tax=Steinernema glaseri TaxID=37863 RepID=A0A1I8A438_9BILA
MDESSEYRDVKTRTDKRSPEQAEMDNGPVVFGYNCKMFPAQASTSSEEGALIAHCINGEQVNVDRYDCRLHLTSVSEEDAQQNLEEKLEDDLEEIACDDERYRDLQHQLADEIKRGGTSGHNEISYDYGSTESGDQVEEDQSDAEPYEVPDGFKLPTGVTKPISMKQHNVIEKTARYVTQHGAQMEIVIKARQQAKSDKFAFLEFDNPLNSYYKVILKYMGEGRYPTTSQKGHSTVKSHKKIKKAVNVREPIAEADEHPQSDEESEDDNYLHPSLLTAPKAVSNSEANKPLIGPKPHSFVSPQINKSRSVSSLPVLSESNNVSVYEELSKTVGTSGVSDKTKDNEEPPKSLHSVSLSTTSQLHNESLQLEYTDSEPDIKHEHGGRKRKLKDSVEDADDLTGSIPLTPDMVKRQQERREKARKFMATILAQKQLARSGQKNDTPKPDAVAEEIGMDTSAMPQERPGTEPASATVDTLIQSRLQTIVGSSRRATPPRRMTRKHQ